MTDLENIDVVHVLADTFRETGDLDYLDNAIALTQEIITASSPTDVRKILQPLLASLLDMKGHPASATEPVPEPVFVTIATDMEELSVVQTLKEAFLETGDFDYIDNAIALTEELIASSCPTDVRKVLQPLLASLLDMKSQSPSATEPVPDPMFVTITTDMEELSVVQTLMEAFLDTGDVDYMYNAIAFTQEIITASSPTDVRKILQPLLASLLDMKGHPASATGPVPAPMFATITTDIEEPSVVQTVEEARSAVQAVAEEWIAQSRSPTDARKILQDLLAIFSDRKGQSASATQPVRQPISVTSATSATEPVPDPMFVTITTDMEELSVVQTLREAFLDTGDFDYIDTAIALAEELIAVSSPTDVRQILQPLLAGLLDTKSMESLSVGFTLVLRFISTGDLDYLDNAILVMHELSQANLLTDERSEKVYDYYLSLKVVAKTSKDTWIDNSSKTAMPQMVSNYGEITDTWAFVFSNTNNYFRTGDINDLDCAIAVAEGLLSTTSDMDTFQQRMMNYLRGLYHIRLPERTGRTCQGPVVTGTLTATNSKGLAATKPESRHLALKFPVQNQLAHGRFERLGATRDLDDVITFIAESVAALPAHDADRGDRLHYLSMCHYERFQRLGERDDLEHAIEFISQALAAPLPEHAKRADRLHCLSLFVCSRSLGLSVPEDLQHSILAVEKAVPTVPSNRGTRLSYMADRPYKQYKRLDALEDLNTAFRIYENSAAATAADDPDGDLRVLSIDKCLLERLVPIYSSRETRSPLQAKKPDRYGPWRHLAYPDMSILRTEEARAMPASDDPARVVRLINFGNALFRRFIEHGNIDDLQTAIGEMEEALVLTCPQHPERYSVLLNLSCLWRIRYAWLGAPEDNTNATWAEASVIIPGANYSDRSWTARAFFLINAELGKLCDSPTGSESLDQSIVIGENALAASSPKSEFHATILEHLSNTFRRRFEHQGALADIEKSIELGEGAVASSHPGERARAYRLNNLGNCYLTRFQRSCSLQDLIQATEAVGEALSAHPRGPRQRSTLSTAGFVCASWFLVTDDRSHLDKAIMYCEATVAATPPNHYHRATAVGNLSLLLYRRFEWFKERGDLVSGIQMAMEAQSLCHGIDNTALVHLGDILETWAIEHSTTKVDDIGVALRDGYIPRLAVCLETRLFTWALPLLPSPIRIHAARGAARILARECSWKHANSLLVDAVELLPTIAPKFLTREDQEETLSNVVGLPAETMSVGLQAGCTPYRCLSLLELGRGIIMSFVIDCRSDLSDLRALHPGSFHKLNTLRIEIDAPLHSIRDELNMDSGRRNDEDRRFRRLQAQGEIDEILAYIRTLPGLQSFQRPPSREDLMAMAAEGPIVICNCSLLRSDAIIVTTTAIKSLCLPGLVYSEIADRISQFPRLVRGSLKTSAKRNSDMAKALFWLWEVAVEPVFEELGLGDTNEPEIDSKLPRIWWIGVGILASAPFHAAGDHSRGSTKNTLSRAISSYIPTIKALSYARQKKLDLDTDPRLLCVAMPTTPETPAIPSIAATNSIAARYCIDRTPGTPAKKWQPLKGALKEINQIVALMRESSVTGEVGHDGESNASAIILDSPTVTLVLQKLPAYQIIHFACHGVSNKKSPSESHLILLGDPSSGPGKLTVSAIASMNLERAQIAYLSACSTADNSSIPLADESIHIASGFQLAGFSHVLAALWPANDQACQQVAVEFYRRLFNAEPRGVTGHRAVSTAFHYAVKKLRDANLGLPIMWACFIHTGA